MSVPRALALTNNPCVPSSLYKRLKRYNYDGQGRDSRVGKEIAASALIELGSGISSLSDFTPPPPTAVIRQETKASSRKRKLGGMAKPGPTSGSMEVIPRWLDKRSVTETMTKRAKRTPAEVNRGHHQQNLARDLRHKKYSTAFKKATMEYHGIVCGPNKGKRGFGAKNVAEKWNKQLLNSPNDRKLSESRIQDATKKGQVGISPVKRGRKRLLPSELYQGLSMHVPMMQIAGEGEATARAMVTTTKALTVGTSWEDSVNADYAWRAVRRRHPEVVMPTKAKDNEDHRVEWLTFQNINDWTDAAKKLLIDMGMVKDEPGIISE